jgi:hypothetical protein
MASSQQKESTLLPLAASVGLFLATAALSQWIQQGRSTTNNRDSGSLDEKEFEDLRRWYSSRRVYDRLSYENLQTSIPPSARGTLSDEEILGDNKEETEWNKQNRKQRRVSSAAALDTAMRQSTSVLEIMHPNADSDFHPKNRNWRHFEHFNESDRRRHLEKLNSVPKITNDVGGASPEQAEEEDLSSSSYDEAQSISSEGSGSSEEQFVWMKHHHRASVHPSQERKNETWPEAIRKRLVPAGLTNLLSSTVHETEPQIDYMDAQNKPQRRSLSSMSSDEENIEKTCGDGHTTGISSPFQLVKRMLSYTSAESSVAEDADNEVTPPKVESNNRILRALYNARIMPEKLVMIRHGQSMGNIDENLYATLPDNAMPLTDLGWEQARAAGKVLKEKILVPGQTVHFIVSPYVRTVETFHGLASAWSDPKEFSHIKDKDERIKKWYGRLIELGLTWIEDSRIREQDFGNYQVSFSQPFCQKYNSMDTF